MLKSGLFLLAITASVSGFANVKTDNIKPVIIADTIHNNLSLLPKQSLVQGGDSSNELLVTHEGAAFIKVHFSYFNLPEGAYVVVTNPQGSESYVYDGISHNKATFNNSIGENGLASFSAMSIFGDTAIIKLVMPENGLWEEKHGIKIDRYNAGHTTAIMPENKMSDASTESTCGVNERRDVACWVSSHPVEHERTRPVARLLMSGSGLCTGWRVGDNNHMFTNNHCLSTLSELQDTEVWFNYQNTTCGGSTKAGTVKVTGKDLFKTDYNLDYTLFSVNNFNTIASFGNFGIETRLPTLGELIYIAQHGSGNPKELAIESDQNANGLCQIDVATATGRAPNTDTGYFCDTIGGSSGSPVIASSSNKVIALHHFGGCENQGVQMHKIWPQVSSYFGGVPPVGDGGSGTQNNPPVAQATISCTALSCTFDGTASTDTDGSITSYSWDFGDGNTSSNASTSHTFQNNGAYNVTLTVTDNESATGSYSETVTVSDGGSNELQSGVPVNNLSGAKDEVLTYFISTTENNSVVNINMSGGNGDADMYVKVGAEPSKTDYECRPFKNGNNETCTVTVSSPDNVYISLIGYSAFSGVSLVADVTVSSGNGFPQTNLSANQGEWLRFTYTVPNGVSQSVITINGGSGDADLYVRKSNAPTTATYDCRPFQSGNNETCTINVTSGDELHIGIRAYNNFTGVTVDVN